MELPQHHSDVVVVGGELGGVFAAALLARRGLRVLVLGHGEIEGHSAIGPALVPENPFLIADFETPSALHTVVEELGLRQDVRRQLPFATPPLQLVDTDHRLDLFEDEEERAAELRREFGDEGPQLAQRLRQGGERLGEVSSWLDAAPGLGESGFFARRRLARYLSSSPLGDALSPLDLNDHPLERWMRALVPFTTHTSRAAASATLTARAAARLLLGTRASPGGERSLLARFARAFCLTHGGKVLSDDRIARLDLSKRGQIVVEIDGNRTARVSHFVIDASRGDWLAERIESERAQRAYNSDRARLEAAAVVEARHVLMRREGLPEGIAAKVLYSDDDGNDYLIAVDREPLPVGDRASVDGLATVSIAHVVEQPSPASQQSLRTALLKLMPFAERHFVQELGEGAWARPLYRPREDGAMVELGPMRAVASSHGRLLRVGADVLPAWGLEGEFRAALVAADYITRKLVGRRPRNESSAKSRR